MKQAFYIETLPMEVTLVALENAPLPLYLGSTLRGALGQALRETSQPAFDALFCNNDTANGQKDVLNPFVIEPPMPSRDPFRRGEGLIFGFTLLGDAAQFARDLVEALKVWERPDCGLGIFRKPFRLMEIKNAAQQRRIWHNGGFFDAAAKPVPIPFETLEDVSEMEIRLLTPLRIRRDGEILQNFDFPTLIRNMTNKIEQVAKHCGGFADADEIRRIQGLAQGVQMVYHELHQVSFERFSNRLGHPMDLGGMMGCMRFRGELSPFVPWVRAAKELHIGKNTTFGLGRYETTFT